MQNVALTVRIRDVTYGNGYFVAIANDGNIAVSVGGTDWIVLNLWYENFRRVHFGNGRFVIVGNDGTCLSAEDPMDAASWIRREVPTKQNLHDVFALPDGSYITVGNNGMILKTK